MSLEHVILGWLRTGPGSGYDLVRQLDQGLAWFWSAPHSQIYPLLRKMEEAGLVTSHSEIVGERLEKRIYSVTPAGVDKVEAWAAEAVRYPPNRDVERLKLIFGDHGSTEDIRRHLQDHRTHYTERRDTLKEFAEVLVSRRHARIESRIARGVDDKQRELILELRRAAYEGDIRRAEGEISWAEDLLAWLDDFEQRWAQSPAQDGG
ncbi:Transcriptional regulator, PadR family [Actinomycetales bacterium JB111]|nr:Transcriptional regulator, PadR family [Actinomycetales bacterium JB111]